MGDVGIEEEFDLKGINYLGGPKDGEHKVELKAGYAMPHDPDVMLCFHLLCSAHILEGVITHVINPCHAARSLLLHLDCTEHVHVVCAIAFHS